jgi:hypothetical protein
MIVFIVSIVYHFVYLSRDRASSIILDYTTKTKWDGEYLRSRAKSIQKNKLTFAYKGSEYNTSSGKKIKV